MKNVHIIERPTIEILGVSPYGKSESNYKIECFLASRNIHITSDEYIGLNWYLDGDLVRKGVIDDKDYWSVRKDYKKIVMTTDKKLIKDGVQPIPEDFLKWLVENPSCEEVKVKKECCGQCDERLCEVYDMQMGWTKHNTFYKIIIPKENLGYDDSVLTLQLTKEEARGLLTCIIRTSANGKALDIGEMVEEQLVKFLNI